MINPISYPESRAGVKRAIGMNKVLGHNVGDIVSPTFNVGDIVSPTFNVGDIVSPTFNVGETISPTFAEDTASKIGVSPRTIRRDVQERDIRGQIS